MNPANDIVIDHLARENDELRAAIRRYLNADANAFAGHVSSPPNDESWEDVEKAKLALMRLVAEGT